MKSNSDTPYFPYPDMLTLRTRYAELSPSMRSALKTHVALNAADPHAVALFVDLGGDDWLHIYPADVKEDTPDTNKAIDTFLSLYATKENDAETALLEKLIFNPTPDYATMLAREEKKRDEHRQSSAETDKTPDAQDAMIASFLNAHATPDVPAKSAESQQTVAADIARNDVPPENQPETTPSTVPSTTLPPAPPADAPTTKAATQPPTAKPSGDAPRRNARPHGSLAESLAMGYIKRKQYQRAYDIIYQLNLNNPEKSVYFADQLRFLQKLIRLQGNTTE